MRRLFSSTVLTGLLTPVLLALPVSTPSAPRPHPVRATAAELAVLPVAGSAEPVGAVLAQAVPGRVAPFQTLGASWDAGSIHAGQQAEVRTRVAGRWTSWRALEPADTAPDAGSRDARSALARTGGRQVAEPVWVGHADGVQARVRTVRAVGLGAAVPAGLRLVLVDGGTSAADTHPVTAPGAASSALAGEPQPAVRTRAEWGADESLRTFNSGCTKVEYGATLKVGFVHHTDTPNGYSPADVPGMIRSIYAYHVKTQGWCDIGYNFLVDRFGVVWEGRYGGMDKPVIGAHTGGFNNNSFAASLLGTYASLTPSDATLDALEHLYAWKLGLHYRDPLGQAVLTSAGGGTAKYAAGTQVTFNAISGHRDAGNTTCPGDAAYSQLDRIRAGVKGYLGTGLVTPATTATRVTYGGTGPTVTAGVLQDQTWRLDLRQGTDGAVQRSWSGSTATTLSQVVELSDAAGVPLAPGGYSLVLSSAAGDDPALSWTSPLLVTAPAATGPGAPAVPGDFVPVTPTRLLDTRSGLGQFGIVRPVGPKDRVDVQVTGAGGVPSTGVTAVAVNVTGVQASRPTFLTVFPADSAQAGTSTVNLVAGATRASLVLPRVGPDGRVSVANDSGSVGVLMDVVGYYRSDTPASRYHAITPRRLLDTRRPGSTRVARDSSVTVPVAGLGDVPAEATGVTVNITAVHPTSGGFLTAAPSASARAKTSTLNYTAGQIVANRAVTGLSGGSLAVFSGGSASDVLVDVVGWFGPADSTGQQYTAVTPGRILDTRHGLGLPSGPTGVGMPAGPASTTVLLVAGQAGVPVDATAVVLTLTGTGPTAETFLTAWAGGARPGTSDLNLLKGSTVANLAVVPMGQDGTVSIFNAAGSTHLVADVLGYFRSPTAVP